MFFPAFRATALIAFASIACACHNHDSDATPTSAVASARPVDQLGPNELPEGPYKAFGLVLPKGLRVDARGTDNVEASGPLSRESVANYVRARVRDGEATVGAAQTIFTGVRVPAEAARPLEIRVFSDATGITHVRVKDTTPPVVPHYATDAERLRATGLTPEGHIADPKNLE